MPAAHRERSVLALFVIGVLVCPFVTRAAELVFSPSSGSFGVGEEISVRVQVNPGGDSVNAADGTLSFDPALLSVERISKDGSGFSLWTAEPEFSNSAGTVTFSGGTPTAFSAQKDVLTVVFTAEAVGTAALSFSEGSILAADGQGTDVYVAGAGASYTITEATEEAEDGESVEGGSFLPAPSILSETHPKEDQWYATSTVLFSWKMPPDATGVRSIFTDEEEAEPDEELEGDATNQRVDDVADGIWYAFVQFNSEFGWGEIGRRAFRVDTTPPAEFDIALIEGDTPKFSFLAEDALSGMDKYEILFGETSMGTVRAQDLSDGYPVPPQEGGVQRVVVKAFDKAGNVRESAKEMTLPKVEPKAKLGEEEESPPFFTIERILLILFAMAIGALITLNMYARKNADQEKARILHEVALVRDKNDKVFSAMREEFEQMVNDFDEKPQLTPDEREFLEKIKDALDISEEVVDSSMEELKKMIRG